MIIIVAYFGGLRHTELMDLQMEKLNVQENGIIINHCRAKQRSDKTETRFLIPKKGKVNYSDVVEHYLTQIKNDFNIFTGRMFFKGTQASFSSQYMGKNTISKVPCEMASLLQLDSPALYTFHSLRRSSATAAADDGASVQQMMDFFGWSNPKMPQEYVSTSKASITGMANRLVGIGASGERAECEATIVDKPKPQHYVFEKSDKIVIVENVTCTNFSI